MLADNLNSSLPIMGSLLVPTYTQWGSYFEMQGSCQASDTNLLWKKCNFIKKKNVSWKNLRSLIIKLVLYESHLEP